MERDQAGLFTFEAAGQVPADGKLTYDESKTVDNPSGRAIKLGSFAGQLSEDVWNPVFDLMRRHFAFSD